MKVAIYARVSTHDQNTLDMQIQAMTEYVTSRGWNIVKSICEIESGEKKRQLREKLFLAARRQQLDVIVVWKLDRWGRSVTDLLHNLNELNELGIGFISITEALDLTTASGRAMAGLLAVFSEFEREILRERVKAGIAHARNKGKTHGRPPSAKKHKEQVISLYKEGKNKSEIARKLGISRTSVRRILSEGDFV